MRDPNRIPIILEKLRQVWEAAPDLRLVQLISNTARKSSLPVDSFNLEDNVLEASLDREIANMSGRYLKGYVKGEKNL